jgi:hypothetical protein
MASEPQTGRWTRREFLTTAGLAVTPWTRMAHAQGLKTITASHSVSTFVYGQHLVAAQKKFFAEPRSCRRSRRARCSSRSATRTIR